MLYKHKCTAKCSVESRRTEVYLLTNLLTIKCVNSHRGGDITNYTSFTSQVLAYSVYSDDLPYQVVAEFFQTDKYKFRRPLGFRNRTLHKHERNCSVSDK